jgi:phosphatidylserine/phosphatidylglycerophosphate/cardiolipin synthase-like enzyme
MNLDTDAPKDNREYLAQDTSSTDIAEAEAIFEADYAGTSITPTGNLSTETPQATAVPDLIAAGGEVRGYVYGGSALDIHAKALVADGTRAYVGSENFTGGSLGYNRELGVYFSEASEVSKVDSTIVADFNAGSTYSSQ